MGARGALAYDEFAILSSLAGSESCTNNGAHGAVLANLERRGFVSQGAVTDRGLEALEPYRVQRAIVMAAGFGSRMVPVTYRTPKPLVRVNGKRIIDGVLDALVDAGISEIYLVRGYLAEQFDQLLVDYPMLTFIENPHYDAANNISSIVAARDYLQNAYVCEADLVLKNSSLISPYQYWSNYLGAPVDATDDWCFKTSDGIITDLLVGSRDCHHMYGISYWTSEDGIRLGSDAEALYNQPGGSDRYWDEVALRAFSEHYTVHVRECAFDDVVEIDTFEELVQVDPSYATYDGQDDGAQAGE